MGGIPVEVAATVDSPFGSRLNAVVALITAIAASEGEIIETKSGYKIYAPADIVRERLEKVFGTSDVDDLIADLLKFAGVKVKRTLFDAYVRSGILDTDRVYLRSKKHVYLWISKAYFTITIKRGTKVIDRVVIVDEDGKVTVGLK